MAILLPLFLIAAMIAFPAAAVIRLFVRGVEYQTIWNVVFVFSVVIVLVLMLTRPSTPAAPAPTPQPVLQQRTVTDDLEQLHEERSYEATAEAAEELRRNELFRERQESEMSDCTCQYNAYNCADFATGNDAQACYQHCLNQTGSDVHWLDDDQDGSACELTPRE